MKWRKNNLHEIDFVCDDGEKFRAGGAKHGIRCNKVMDQGRGLVGRIHNR